MYFTRTGDGIDSREFATAESGSPVTDRLIQDIHLTTVYCRVKCPCWIIVSLEIERNVKVEPKEEGMLGDELRATSV